MEFEAKVKKHHHIQISDWDKMLLYIHYTLPCIMKISCWKNKERVTRLFKKGTEKAYKQLNVFRILRKLN